MNCKFFWRAGSIKIFHFLFAFFLSASVSAGGLLGDIVNVVVPGAGTTLDNIHRDIKEAIPPYKAVEEGATHLVNETFVQSTAPLLEQLIIQSRNDALSSGVQPIPNEIRRNLSGFIPEKILNIARYRVSGGGDLSLQVNAIRYGEAQAITLDYVIVFANSNDAFYNPSLWAHELTHVIQYDSWGVKDFAIRYVRSHNSVENDAYGAQSRYAAWVGMKNANQWAGDDITESMINQPASPFATNNVSSTCGTVMGVCKVNGFAPIGTQCWCGTPNGAVFGSLVPETVAQNQNVNNSPAPIPVSFNNPVSPPVGLPSGYGMQVCGCWGPNPSQIAAESRCASGSVRLNVCPGQCAPGHPPYAYVCN